MPDYNIYLHSVGGNGNTQQQNPTKAWASSTEDSGDVDFSNVKEWFGKVNQGLNTAQNPDSLVSSGISAAAKAIPAVAIAMAAIMITKRLYESANQVVNYFATESGDYRFSNEMQAFLQTISSVFRPFSTGLAILREHQAITLNESKMRQKTMLLGDSVINSYTNRGV